MASFHTESFSGYSVCNFQITSHFTKLIQDKAVSINDIMLEDKIEILTKAFYGYKEESLTPMKEQLGDDFSWEELKMFKASLNS